MKILLVCCLLLFVQFNVIAQIQSPVKWSYVGKKTSSTEAAIYIKASINNGWHIYSINQKEGGPNKTVFSFTPSKDFDLIGKVIEPKPITKFEEVFDMNVMYFEKSVVFSQKIKLKAKQVTVKGKVEFMVCTNKECLPPDEVAFSIPVK